MEGEKYQPSPDEIQESKETDALELRVGDMLVNINGEENDDIFKGDDGKYHPLEIIRVDGVSVELRDVGSHKQFHTHLGNNLRLGVVRKNEAGDKMVVVKTPLLSSSQGTEDPNVEVDASDSGQSGDW